MSIFVLPEQDPKPEELWAANIGEDAATRQPPNRDALLWAEVDRLEVREEAARIVRHKRAGALGAPVPQVLRDFLAVKDEPARYRVEGLWPVGGRVVLAAQYKAGKTTMRDNLVRALVDDEPFLGTYAVQPFAGTVVLLDNELDPRMLRRWLRDQGIQSDDRWWSCRCADAWGPSTCSTPRCGPSGLPCYASTRPA